MAMVGGTFDSTSPLLHGTGKTNEGLSPSATAVPANLRVILWQLEPNRPRRFELERFGIDVVDGVLAQFTEAMIASGQFDVLLIVASQDQNAAVNDSLVRRAVGIGQAAGVGVCLCLSHEASVASREWLVAGVDSLGFTDNSPAMLAVAAFTAHNCAVMRRTLKKQVSELEEKLERNRLIQQAKSILAEQLRITEGAALRHLRKEARDQRRTMWELARVINEAHRIFNSQPKLNRSAGRKLDSDLMSSREVGGDPLGDPTAGES